MERGRAGGGAEAARGRGDRARSPSNRLARAARKDIAAITYGANPEKKGLDRVLAAWLRASNPDEELVVAGLDEAAGTQWLRRTEAQTGRTATGVNRRRGRGPRGRGGAGPWRARCASPASLARDEYRALLRRSRVFVAAARREDYGIAQLEALADRCLLVTAALARAVRGAANRPRARRAARQRRAADPGRARRPGPPLHGGRDRRARALRREAVDRVVKDELLPRLI